MPVSAQTILDQLPPYRDEWVLIKDDQRVKDIVKEVLKAHDEFAPYYDNIALYFDGKNVEEICNKIYGFIKKNIRYKEESEKDQTTALPAGLLLRGQGDCKHYSGLAGGILDALNRTGKKIKWCYCFASYKYFDKDPHHVFIKVFDGPTQHWFDPTPSADNMEPVWMTDKFIKADKMALRRNIAGALVDDYIDYEDLAAMGKRPKWQLKPLLGPRGNPTAAGPGPDNPYLSGQPFLGFEFYNEDGLSTEGTDWNQVANDINAAIQLGPSPGHTFPKDFIKWIFDTSTKGWNFYWPHGADPEFDIQISPGYVHWMITDDGRLTLDQDVKLDDLRNIETQALTAQAQRIINAEDPSPYPVTPRHIKEFSQLKYGSVDKRNLFTERRGDSFFKEATKAIGKTLKVVGRGLLTIIGSAPRNAFLGLVGINAFNLAGKLATSIEEGKWDLMAKKWKNLGGNPIKLQNTINDGKSKKAILGDAEPGIHINKIGEPLTATALIAIAAPVVAAMLAFIKDPQGKLKDVLSAVKGSLKSLYPDADFTPLGFLDTHTGQEIQWQVDPKDDETQGGGDQSLVPGGGSGSVLKDLQEMALKNPMPAAAVIGGLVYVMTNSGGGKTNIAAPVIAASAVYYYLKKQPGAGGGGSVSDKRLSLLTWMASTQDSPADKKHFSDAVNMMTDAEIQTTHEAVFDYLLKSITIPAGTPLRIAMQAVIDKYKIFT